MRQQPRRLAEYLIDQNGNVRHTDFGEGQYGTTEKDIRLLLRDARAVFVLLVLPLVFITIIGLTMGKLFGWRNTNQILRIGVVNAIDYDQIGGPGWDDEEDAKPEGEEESEEMAAQTGEQSEELKVEKIEDMETEHEKAKRRKRGNNTQ